MNVDGESQDSHGEFSMLVSHLLKKGNFVESSTTSSYLQERKILVLSNEHYLKVAHDDLTVVVHFI